MEGSIYITRTRSVPIFNRGPDPAGAEVWTLMSED